MGKKLEKFGDFFAGAFVPLMYVGTMAICGYVNRNEPTQGEFKKLNNNQIKTVVHSGPMGYTKETYNFKTHTVSQENAFGAPKRGAFFNTKEFPFSKLSDTSNLHIARQMLKNGSTFAKKMNETIAVPHSVMTIIDNKDTTRTTFNTYKDTSYVAYKYKR